MNATNRTADLFVVFANGNTASFLDMNEADALADARNMSLNFMWGSNGKPSKILVCGVGGWLFRAEA